MACIWSPYLAKYALITPFGTCGKTSPMALTSSSLGVRVPKLTDDCRSGNDPSRPIVSAVAPSIDLLGPGTPLILDKPVSRLARGVASAIDGCTGGGGVYEPPSRGPRGPIGAAIDTRSRCGDELLVAREGEEIGKPRTSFLLIEPEGGPSEVESFFDDAFLPIPEKNDRLDEKDETLCIEGDVFIPPSAPLAYCAWSCGYGRFGGSELGASVGSTVRCEISLAVYESARMGNSLPDETLRMCATPGTVNVDG